MVRESGRSPRGRVAAITVRHDDVGLARIEVGRMTQSSKVCVLLRADCRLNCRDTKSDFES